MISNRQPSTRHRALRAYFRSGWAFLIPYLAAYLLYAWLKSPVNPGGAGEGIVKGISERGSVVSGQWSLVPSLLHPPCLLHVYWALHAAHLVLGIIALSSWWKKSILNLQLPTSTGAPGASVIALRAWWLNSSGLRSPISGLLAAVPWILLGLLFWIPGLYLEWPSDPWEHLRRINEWHILDQVTAHSSWRKSSYFLPYSLTGHTTSLSQLSWLNLYHTSVCLLLSWQYFRLARAAGLSERASFVFVLLNTLTFGNNIFSFYRYYGLSSSIFAQIAAIALTRIALETLRPQGGEVGDRGSKTGSHWLGEGWPVVRSLVVCGLAVSALIALTAFNHIQGLGIAGLGVLAIIVWRLVEWKRTATFWLTGVTLLLSIATVLWWPRHPVLDSNYVPNRWLNAFYGFNLLSISSPAFDRFATILGWTGLFNLLAGIILVWRNHVAGWLTIIPPLVLCFPVVAIPFATALAKAYDGGAYIITFHRLLFSIPSGLALLTVFCQIPAWTAQVARTSNPMRTGWAGSLILVACLVTMTASPNGPWSNTRTWNTFTRIPSDLSLHHLAEWPDRFPFVKTPGEYPYVIMPRSTVFAVRALGGQNIEAFFTTRYLIPPGIPSAESVRLSENIANAQLEARYAWFHALPMGCVSTPYSQSGYMSGHWTPRQVALDQVGAPELLSKAQQIGGKYIHEYGTTSYIFAQPHQK